MDFRWFFIRVLLLKLIYLIKINKSNEILGCGGFIKSHADIDFSKVEIKLLTKQGSLKDKVDCSPSNGYYFIPVYDKGDYVLKIAPPPGWSFEPESVEINFDGKTDVCSQGKDVNFVFKGFGITGKVALAGSLGGVKEVKVELRSEDGTDIRKTITDIHGVFSFSPVIPGKYLIKAYYDTWFFSNSEYSVIVQTGNTELPESSLVVSGFNVQGSFTANGQQLSDISVVLFQQKGQTLVSNCVQTNLPVINSGNSKYDNVPICLATVDRNGGFLFKAVAPGKYLIKPAITKIDLKINIQPHFIEFTVTKDSLTLRESFEITGFSVSGRVLASQNGWGIANAKVKLNDEVVATTHTDGSYSIENVKAGTYTLKCEAENLEFPDHTVKMSLSNPMLPDLIVSAFKTCGQILSEKSHIVGITAVTFHTTTLSDPSTGEWCVYLPKGKYDIEVLITDNDKASGIQFFPLVQTVEVRSSPLSGIMFSQLRATVSGEIECLADSHKQCNNIEITLHALDPSGRDNAQTGVVAQDGKYTFKDVLPGNYEVTIPQKNLCWEKTSHDLSVKSSSEKVKPFFHIGYEISVISSHKATLQYSFRSADKDKPQISKEIGILSGVNTFCVQNSGTYTLDLLGCHKYDANQPRSFSTSDANPLIITAVSHKSGVRILSTEKVSEPFKALFENRDVKELVTFIAEDNKVDGFTSYRYDTYLEPQEVISVAPQSDAMLFKPTSKELIGGNDCVDVLYTFTATRGLIIEGKIKPPIGDVKILLTFINNPETEPITAISSSSGSFKFGPLDATLQTELRAEKESYVFSAYDRVRNEFKAHKLCEIIANVQDENGIKLSGVLLSLSGAESFRKNLVTGEDGTIKFHSLSPNQYYLRPMLKEYIFKPNSKVIEIKDGETVKVELIGNRVAYSVFGQITSLNGDPFPNAMVEAISEEGCQHHQEESSSENNGQYRIRGLQPGCKYIIRMKSGEVNTNVERSIPESRTITVANEDIQRVNLIGISPISFTDPIAKVYSSLNDHYKSLRIQIYRKGNTDSPIHSQRVESPLTKVEYNPGTMMFLPRIPRDGKTYFIRLTTSISDKLYKYELPEESFIANISTVYVELNFNPELKSADGDLNQNSISALVLIALVAIAFFKQDLAMELINFICNKISGLVQDFIETKQSKRNKETRFIETINIKEIEQLAEGINAVKKKKPKKI